MSDSLRKLDATALPAGLGSFTPARIGLRRTGDSLATCELLEFQLAHARARDAVHATLEPFALIAAIRGLTPQEAFLLHSAAQDRQTYLKRPDLGRKLNESSRERLRNLASQEPPFDLALILADGLSALAVERHAVPLLAELLPTLARAYCDLRIAPICVVQQGRVAVGDEVAESFSATLAVVLIGERPGLSSPDSLGAYITWRPQPGITTDAGRNCISNIRPEGLGYPEAAARLLYYLLEARRRQLTGTALKDPEALLEVGRP